MNRLPRDCVTTVTLNLNTCDILLWAKTCPNLNYLAIPFAAISFDTQQIMNKQHVCHQIKYIGTEWNDLHEMKKKNYGVIYCPHIVSKFMLTTNRSKMIINGVRRHTPSRRQLLQYHLQQLESIRHKL